ncbi:hypothetical protein Dda_2320 [Drechslerella dactyloides]|uniref:Uncharacterized protein n=1 Tax=Drechslerella dactyloides TaxID=74499 RepID=A0AAD6J556_DREDA|nr:hypothetical protein Dda_2320 [Drechslerella dactyloides]
MKSLPLLSTLVLLSLLAPTLAAPSPELNTRATGHDLKRVSQTDGASQPVPVADQPAEIIVIVSSQPPPTAQHEQSDADAGCMMAADKADIDNYNAALGRLQTQRRRDAAALASRSPSDATDAPTGHGGVGLRKHKLKRAIHDTAPTGHGGSSRRRRRDLGQRSTADEAPTGHGGASKMKLKRARRAIHDAAPTGHGGATRRVKRLADDVPTGHGGRERLARRTPEAEDAPTGHGGVNSKVKRELQVANAPTGHGGVNMK